MISPFLYILITNDLVEPLFIFNDEQISAIGLNPFRPARGEGLGALRLKGEAWLARLADGHRVWRKGSVATPTGAIMYICSLFFCLV